MENERMRFCYKKWRVDCIVNWKKEKELKDKNDRGCK